MTDDESGHEEDLVEFIGALGEVVGRNGTPLSARLAALRAYADALSEIGTVPYCRIVPFAPGRRPTDELRHPGTGVSDSVMLRLGEPERVNRTRFVLEIGELPDDIDVRLSVTLDPLPGSATRVPIEGWENRPLDAGTVGRRSIVRVDAENSLDPHELGFRQGYLRRGRVQVRAERNGVPLAVDETRLDVCDVSELGKLYDRVVDRVLVPDVARQAQAAGVENPGVAYHPWFPVLNIGRDKAALYSEALVSDIVDETRHLSDPAWLLRVGVHLELLTCLGIADAVRDDMGDILSPPERAAFERSEVFAAARRRVDPRAWREVWEQREIVFSRLGLPRTGPVSAGNLLAKRRATLAFLHAHHEDLKHAIELAGRNHHNSQETWHRVFRDAERAVLRQTTSSFPELAFLPDGMREVVLWQRRGLADQQGLYATACVQYRASMNHVAEWARNAGMMDYTGDECIPLEASLLEAQLRDPSRIDALQRGDGYGPTLELTPLTDPATPTTAELEALVAACPIFSLLDPSEVTALVEAARPVLLAPGARFIRQGDPGTSMFIVAHGDVEIHLRDSTGHDTLIELVESGSILGEMSFLTGDPRAATARAGREGAVVYEIERTVFEPLARNHPEWTGQLSELMSDRLARRRRILRDRASTAALPVKIRQLLGRHR